MTSDELYAHFRTNVGDVARPYVWSDEEIYAYMNDAYFMFVRLTGGVSDALSDACLVEAASKEPYSDLDPSILRIRQATLAPDGRAVRVINAQDTENLSDEDFGVLRRLNTSTSIGSIQYMITGLQPGIVRWVNIPDRLYTIQLVVERLPLTPITRAGQQLTDVAAHHHLHLLKWMQYLAYSKPDETTFDKAKAEANQLAFEAYCALAKREKDQYKHKVRVVRYGGI